MKASTALAGSVASGGSAERQRRPAAQSGGHGWGVVGGAGRGPCVAYIFTLHAKVSPQSILCIYTTGSFHFKDPPLPPSKTKQLQIFFFPFALLYTWCIFMSEHSPKNIHRLNR